MTVQVAGPPTLTGEPEAVLPPGLAWPALVIADMSELEGGITSLASNKHEDMFKH